MTPPRSPPLQENFPPILTHTNCEEESAFDLEDHEDLYDSVSSCGTEEYGGKGDYFVVLLFKYKFPVTQNSSNNSFWRVDAIDTMAKTHRKSWRPLLTMVYEQSERLAFTLSFFNIISPKKGFFY